MPLDNAQAQAEAENGPEYGAGIDSSSSPAVDEQSGPVLDRLHDVIDPEVGVNIVDLGLVFGVRVLDGVVHVRMTLTTPGCPLGDYIDDEIRRALTSLPGVTDTYMDLVWEPRWDPQMMTMEAKRQLGWVR